MWTQLWKPVRLHKRYWGIGLPTQKSCTAAPYHIRELGDNNTEFSSTGGFLSFGMQLSNLWLCRCTEATATVRCNAIYDEVFVLAVAVHYLVNDKMGSTYFSFKKSKPHNHGCVNLTSSGPTSEVFKPDETSSSTLCSRLTFGGEVVAGRLARVVAHLHRVETQILLRGLREGEHRPEGDTTDGSAPSCSSVHPAAPDGDDDDDGCPDVFALAIVLHDVNEGNSGQADFPLSEEKRSLKETGLEWQSQARGALWLWEETGFSLIDQLIDLLIHRHFKALIASVVFAHGVPPVTGGGPPAQHHLRTGAQQQGDGGGSRGNGCTEQRGLKNRKKA
ncbi:hypothetical protein EYF80_022127 [Liparis tanakae]|uniref:Uncharacterized protein n=1 Tax=Liparis tanakae TaxID=230148 RepID=A0A4Z2HRP5_9TELE|nr:hypothetical protein EYF80_022127 [Liparis tanakae]